MGAGPPLQLAAGRSAKFLDAAPGSRRGHFRLPCLVLFGVPILAMPLNVATSTLCLPHHLLPTEVVTASVIP